jgi:hypothetical protein
MQTNEVTVPYTLHKGGYAASKISRNASMTNISSNKCSLVKNPQRSKSKMENINNKRKSLGNLKMVNRHFALPTASYINTSKSKESKTTARSAITQKDHFTNSVVFSCLNDRLY